MEIKVVLLLCLLAAVVTLGFACGPTHPIRRRILLSILEQKGCSFFIQTYQRRFSVIDKDNTDDNANPNDSASSPNPSPFRKITYVTRPKNGSETADVPLALQIVLRREFLVNHQNQNQTSVEKNEEEKSNWTLTQILPTELGGSFEWYNLALMSPGTKLEAASHHNHSDFNWKSIETQILEHLNSHPTKEVEYDVVLAYKGFYSFSQPPQDFLLCIRFPGTDKEEIVQFFENYDNQNDIQV